MVLITSATFLEIVTQAVATSHMPVVGAYVEHNSSFSVTALTPITVNTNETNAVTVVGAATGSAVRQLKALSVFNAGTAAKLVTLRMNTSSTYHIICRVTLDVSDMLQFSDTDGWFVLNSIGQVKTGASIALEDDSVTTSKLAALSVTNAKLAQMATLTVKGNSTGGTAAAGDLSMATLFTMLRSQIPVGFGFAVTDEVNAVSAGDNKVKVRLPFAMSLTSITASLSVAQTSGTALQVEVRRAATSLLTGANLVFVNTYAHSTLGSGTQPVLASGPPIAMAQHDEIIVRVVAIGDGTAKGLKVTLHGVMGT